MAQRAGLHSGVTGRRDVTALGPSRTRWLLGEAAIRARSNSNAALRQRCGALLRLCVQKATVEDGGAQGRGVKADWWALAVCVTGR